MTWITNAWSAVTNLWNGIFNDANKKAIQDLLTNFILPQLKTAYGQFIAIAIPIALDFVKSYLGLNELSGFEKKTMVRAQLIEALEKKGVDMGKIPEHWINTAIEMSVVEARLSQTLEQVKGVTFPQS